MDNVLDKSLSDPNVNYSGLSGDKTPPNFACKRNKRKRDDLDIQFQDLKEEILTMIKSMILPQENELKKISPILKEIKNTNCNIENTLTYLTEQNNELKKKIELLEIQAKKDKQYITMLEDKVEDIQRENRKANIEIKNIPCDPKETREDLLKMVLCLSKNIDCNITRSDIKDIYRINTKKYNNTNPPVIIETASTILKTDIIKQCKNFNIKNKQKLRAKHLGFTKHEETPVYIAEQLTPKGARLFYLARDLAKSQLFKFCWTFYGRVYVRKNENSPIIRVNNEAQIHHLRETM